MVNILKSLVFSFITLLLILIHDETFCLNNNNNNTIRLTNNYNIKKQQPVVIVAKFLNQSTTYKCPNECTCQGLSIDCSNRKLTKIPRNIPFNLIKV